MLDIIEIIKLGGYPLSIVAFFYGKYLGKKLTLNKLALKKLKGLEDVREFERQLSNVSTEKKKAMFSNSGNPDDIGGVPI
jgi:hypothetical protein